MAYNKPIKLESARAWRTYLGGKLIDELHGVENPQDSNFPEEWLMSTVQARNSGREDIVEGLSITENGISLKEFIASAPEKILGASHYSVHGDTTGVLVKLLDSMERLTVQVHPTKEKAKELFNSQFGKTECWHILDCRTNGNEKPCIYIGFKEGITRGKWKKCFDDQDIEAMLDCLHCIEVKKGDTFLICGGVPHAIGAGCFLVEIQEPTDYTVRTERVTPSGLKIADFMCHQGLGFDRMFDCFEYEGYSKEETLKKWKIQKIINKNEAYTESEVIGYRDTPMFCLKVIDIDEFFDVKEKSVFSGLYILDGNGEVADRDVKKGDQFFLPANTDGFRITNHGKLPMKVLWYFGPQI